MLKEIKLKKEISNITNLGTNTGLTAVENKLPNVLNWVKKTDYNTKVSEIENNYVTAQPFDNLTSENFTATLKQTNFASKNDIANFVKRQILIINLD